MLAGIKLVADRDTFNPVLEPDVTGTITVLGLHSDGRSEELPADMVVLGAKTKLASGDVDVVRMDGCRIVPGEGGMATIEAVVVADGKTFKDEMDIVVRPFYHPYHQTLVLKIFNIHPRDGQTPSCTFAETLEVIRKTDIVTRGIPKILYLQGWQQGGFDRLFPAWNIVDPRLKREQDRMALDSLRWLIREARQYNTIVSLHVDMVQAYPDSPLWDEYVAKDVVGRDEQGEIILVNGRINHTSYTREWEEGLAQRRIDGLIEMVPELTEGHTIHIDNLITYWKPENRPLSPWHAKPENGGIDMHRETETIRKIFRYWRARGIDVTGEGILWAHPPGEGYYGLQGYSWWSPGTAHAMRVPERLSARGAPTRSKDGDAVLSDYRVGCSMHGAQIWLKDKTAFPGFIEQFCTMTLPWHYLSQHERVALINEVLFYSEGLVAGDVNGRKTIRKGDYVLVDDGNVFVEAKWAQREIIAFSKEGYSSKSWVMPTSWEGIMAADLYKISLDGLERTESGKKIEGGRLALSLAPGEAISIVPS